MTARSIPTAALSSLLPQISALLLIGATAAVAALTVGAAAGLVPWLEIEVALRGEPVAGAGAAVQVGVMLLLLALLGFLPSHARVRRLELTSRAFRLSMDDVTRAYAAVHAADRDAAFDLSREFDAVRDRITWMRAHPDLAELEPDVLEVAAQMSTESRDLAEVYSDAKIGRARSFLRQRQTEIEDYRARIALAQSTVDEIRRWMQAVSVEESLAEAQIDRLRQDLADVTDTLDRGAGDQSAGDRDAGPSANVYGLSGSRHEPRRETLATPAE